MNKLIASLILLAYSSALAAPAVIDARYIRGQGNFTKNFAPNPFAERGVNAGWSASYITAVRDTATGYKLNGISSFKLTTSNTTNYFSSDVMTLDDDLAGAGKNCEARVEYKGDGSTWTFALTQNYGAPMISVPLTNSASGFTTASITYPCGANYNLKLSSSATAKVLNVGNFYFGPASGIGAANVITDWQSYTPTVTSDSGSITNTSLVGRWRRDGDTAEIQVFVGFSGSSGSWSTLNINMPAGVAIDPSKLVQAVDGNMVLGAGDSNTDATSHGKVAVFFRTATQVRPRYLKTVSGTNPVQTSYTDFTSANLVTSGYYVNVTFRVPVLGWTAQTAIRVDQTFDRTGEIMAYAGACPANTVSAMNKTVGITGADYSGPAYYALYAAMWRSGMATSGAGVTISNASEGSAALAWAAGRTIKLDMRDLFLRGVGVTAGISNDATGKYQSDALQGHYHYIRNTGGTALSFNVANVPSGSWAGAAAAENFAAAQDITNGVNGAVTVANENRSKNAGVNYCVNYTGVQAVPLLVGSVTSNTSGLERVERARFNQGGTTPTSQSGAWITSLTPGTLNDGIVVVNFASGIWSAAPTCVVTIEYAPTTTAVISCGVTNVSTASAQVDCAYLNGAAGNKNFDFWLNIVCMGPR